MAEVCSAHINVERFQANPLITPALSPTLGNNICGPSIIRVPDWLPNRMGRYYMYFAHHSGSYIRLAFSDELYGPWQVHEPGTLQLEDAHAFHDHVASPDVHVDEGSQQIRMYFHGPAKAKPGQWTGVAYSKDGVNFTAKPHLLGKFYFRVWQWQKNWYALAKNNNEGWGELYRAPHPDGPFELRGNILKGMRHAAVWLDGYVLQIFYTRVGDAPERILTTSIDMGGDWLTWAPIEPREVMRPKEFYEGVQYPNEPSEHGPAISAHQLRDPFVIAGKDARINIFYTGAGEASILGAVIQF